MPLLLRENLSIDNEHVAHVRCLFWQIVVSWYVPQYLDYIPRQTEWESLTTLVRIQRERRINDEVTAETAYFISSRSASAAHFLEAVRGHWAIGVTFLP